MIIINIQSNKICNAKEHVLTKEFSIIVIENYCVILLIYNYKKFCLNKILLMKYIIILIKLYFKFFIKYYIN